jgi:hypothetical protein
LFQFCFNFVSILFWFCLTKTKPKYFFINFVNQNKTKSQKFDQNYQNKTKPKLKRRCLPCDILQQVAELFSIIGNKLDNQVLILSLARIWWPGVNFINIYARENSPSFWANGTWRMAHRFGKFWPIILALNFVNEIEWHIFRQMPASFCLAKKFGEIDPSWKRRGLLYHYILVVPSTIRTEVHKNHI